MTIEELKECLSFLTDENIQKHLSVYVTVPGSELLLFNIKNENLPDLLELFIQEIIKKLFEQEYSIENYSSSMKRVDAIYKYDMEKDKRTVEMNNLVSIMGIQNPSLYDASKTSIEKINGIYLLIKNNTNRCFTLYKQITAIDKIYARSSFCFFGKDNQQFERQEQNMLKITSTFQMFQLDDEIYLMDMERLEKTLKLDEILKRETERDIQVIIDKKITTNDVFLKKACEKPSICKKLRHALNTSKIIQNVIPNSDIIDFAKKQKKMRFHFNKAGNLFELKSRIEAERFIQLLDDDILYSELSKENYLANEKVIL